MGVLSETVAPYDAVEVKFSALESRKMGSGEARGLVKGGRK